MTQVTHNNRKVFSLKWKTVILLSLVLIATNSILAALSYYQIESQFNENRELIIKRQKNELYGLVNDSYRDLEYFSSFVHILLRETNTNTPLHDKLESIFTRNEVVFELEWDLKFARIYDESLQLIYNWRGENNDSINHQLLKKSQKNEVPVQSIQCINECIQYQVSPLLLSSSKTGFIVTARPLTNMALSYQRITGSNIAILSKNPTTGEYSISAATNISKTRSVINDFINSKLNDAVNQRTTLTTKDGLVYEVTATHVESDANKQTALVVLVDNVTDEYTSARKNINLIITSSITGLVIAELLLLLLLWLPMARIRQLSEVLPSLSLGAYEKVRERVKAITGGFRIPDEIDVLAEATSQLSEQLESLNTEIDKHTRKLENQRDALLLERDFNTDLLDTAQAIIITHDKEGTIISVNNYGLNITEYDETDILGKSTSVLFGEHGLSTDVTSSVNNLRTGEQTHFQHESEITTKSNKKINISWYHSRVSHTTTDDAIILSIGLDITARHLAEERLGWIADHDPLTKLFNRRRFQQEFDRILKESLRYHRNGALLFIDLDHFKLVNDTNGHHAGDLLLKSVAESMKSATRESDLLARLGGDEFALIIPESNKKSAMKVARKIMNNLNKMELPNISGSYKPSGSIGITLFPEHGTNTQELMGNADIAMYQAKQNGRGICHMYSIDEHAREQITHRIQWKQKIEEALQDELFYLNYQPIYDINSKSISHYEVLIRLRDNDGTIIGPAIFIPEAEQTGQINTIDRLVIDLAIKKLATLNSSGYKTNFSINLSGRVIDDPEIIAYIKDRIQSSGIDPSQVIFEVTETAAVADIGSAKSLMQEIIDFGCQFALDDFGVGFASFYYLKQLPVAYVKIDGAFIRNLPNDEADQLFVKALKDVASGLNKKTIAEFVEDNETLMLLEEYQIDYAQGYHIGKPADDIINQSEGADQSDLVEAKTGTQRI